MLQYEKTDVWEGIDPNKTSESKECLYALSLLVPGTLNMLDLDLNHMFLINVMMFWWLLMN